MLVDRIILILIWIVTAILVVLATPRHKLREAMVIFMFKQVLTWLLGLIMVQYNLIEYPIREFPYASRSSFSFEYFIFPAICVIFNLKYPEHKSSAHKFLWYMFFPSWMTAAEVLLEKYTDLIEYISWDWYWTWISLLVTFYISRTFYLWYFKIRTADTTHS